MTGDATTGFDRADVNRAATANDVSPGKLRDLLEAHQRLVRETPGTGGVAGLLYEWRRAFGRDPVVARNRTAFHLAVEPHVWTEYTRALGTDETANAALRAVHAATVVETTADDREPMVVWRA